MISGRLFGEHGGQWYRVLCGLPTTLDFLPFHESSALDAEQYGAGLQAYFPQQIVLHDFFRESADGQSQLEQMSGCCR